MQVEATAAAPSDAWKDQTRSSTPAARAASTVTARVPWESLPPESLIAMTP
ncbi:hypothetical protein [Actinacidiphila soli]|uniref:hypothetical protein n=1 Tax=Actinacidiphila soli TaxID=2487275 RepID=UPI0013E30972|nr:hypothetical protein [Actinacidiphila soli]